MMQRKVVALSRARWMRVHRPRRRGIRRPRAWEKAYWGGGVQGGGRVMREGEGSARVRGVRGECSGARGRGMRRPRAWEKADCEGGGCKGEGGG